MIAHDIVIRPIITEKSMLGAKVNTVSVRGKWRRQRYKGGYTKSWKKAIVTLTEDSKPIEFFEGMM